MSRSADVDLAIVGAGAAGVGAALEARERGLRFRVLESASRPGGRAWTETASLRHPVDLGCHWLHSASRNPLREAADALGVAYDRGPLVRRFHDGHQLLPLDEGRALFAAWDGFTDAAAEAKRAGRELSVEKAADTSHPSWPWFSQWMEHLFAVHPDGISTADVAEWDDTHEDWPVPSGYGALVQRVASGLEWQLDCPVQALDLGERDVVTVHTPRGALRARAVVMTVSLGVLHAESIAVRPSGWPDWKLRALEGVRLGTSCKVALELDAQAVDPELAGVFVHCLADPPDNVAWHFLPAGMEMAVAYLGGEACRALALAGEDDLARFALADLERRLGSDVRKYAGRWRAEPWDANPHVRGGYSYCRAGYGNRRAELAAPVEDRVLFAGEACSLRYCATAHGAWLSGRDAVAAWAEATR